MNGIRVIVQSMESGRPQLFFNIETGELRIDGSAAHTTSNTFVPLHTILTDPDFVIADGQYNQPSAREWTPEDAVWIGSLVARPFIEQLPAQTMTSQHINVLNKLGVLPDLNFIARRFGSIQSFQEAIGSPLARPSTKFDHMSRQDLIDFLQLEREKIGLKGPFTIEGVRTLFRSGITPGLDYLQHRFGSIGELNEYFGFPNAKTWSTEDCAQYGARIIEELGIDALTAKNLDKLAKNNHGLYAKAIANRFNGSILNFKEAALNAYKLNQSQAAALAKLTEAHFIEYPASKDLGQNDKERIYGLFVLTKHLLGDAVSGKKVDTISRHAPNDAVEKIIAARPGLTVADVEIEAQILGYYDQIWPCKLLKHRPLRLDESPTNLMPDID